MSPTVTVDVGDLETVLMQGNPHHHLNSGVWDLSGAPCADCAARRRLWAAVDTSRRAAS